MRPRLRRIAAGADTPQKAVDTCIPVEITGKSGNNYNGYSFSVVSDQTAKTNKIYFPHLSISTEIPAGAVVLGHYVDTVAIQTSND